MVVMSIRTAAYELFWKHVGRFMLRGVLCIGAGMLAAFGALVVKCLWANFGHGPSAV